MRPGPPHAAGHQDSGPHCRFQNCCATHQGITGMLGIVFHLLFCVIVLQHLQSYVNHFAVLPLRQKRLEYKCLSHKIVGYYP